RALPRAPPGPSPSACATKRRKSHQRAHWPPVDQADISRTNSPGGASAMNAYVSSLHPSVRFARLVFRIAAFVGLVEIVPLYFSEGVINRTVPPAITHPEFYYGFIGVVVAWQVAYLIISEDPVRFQPLFPAIFLEKLLYPAALFMLFMDGRVQSLAVLAGGAVDLFLLSLFVASWVKMSKAPADPWAIASASRWW